MTNETQIDVKTFQRIAKLLALAKDKGATEAEAQVAMEKAQELMLANNLTVASLEASGASAGVDGVRQKSEVKTNAMSSVQQGLMSTLAKINFCYVTTDVGYTARGRLVRRGYQIIGRKANVVSLQVMFEYLIEATERETKLAQDLNSWDVPTARLFREGMIRRIDKRVEDRHEASMKEQASQAASANAAARHPSTAPGTGLVVVMTDFAQEERWANLDLAFGWYIGTSKAKALEELARQKDRNLVAKDYVHTPWVDNRTPEQKAKDEKAQAKWDAKWEKGRYEREAKEWRKRNHPAFRAGVAKGSEIGLDTQVKKGEATKKLS